MSDERKPVICPCGKNMRLIVDRCVDWKQVPIFRAYYRCKCGWVSPVHTDYSKSIACDRAYAAATQRSTNRPLTLPELFDLDGNMDAVWVVDSKSGTRVMGAEEACEWASDADTVLFFVRKPTPADIEAARKELDCK